MNRTLFRAAAALALAASLGGCAVLGLLTGGGGQKNKAQLYRFGGPAEAVVARTGPDTTTPIQLESLTFQPAAEGDRMLAINGAEAFYIAQSRWVSPAEELFTAAAGRAFDRVGLQLTRRGQPIQTGYGLALTVPVFETRYDAGLEAAPTVVVEVRAAMLGDRQPLGSTRAAASVPAASNNVTAIVAAYDAASRQTLDAVAAWAAATARSAPRTSQPT
ncbi:MAG: ABC-type transport auxiliary lipoprotein family protein [Pseudomonadota bacterium]|nr:ABC-type transport auxiliary lipoprotein family protein [Pseudomonadota bacterium]